MKKITVCFAGHRFGWHCYGMEEPLRQALINLIGRGALIFYVTKYGYFNELAKKILNELKIIYTEIKIVRVDAFYKHNEGELAKCYDESVLADVELVHFKGRIQKCNEWIVDNSDVIVCGITYKEKSGAYRMFEYAKRKCKEVVMIDRK